MCVSKLRNNDKDSDCYIENVNARSVTVKKPRFNVINRRAPCREANEVMNNPL